MGETRPTAKEIAFAKSVADRAEISEIDEYDDDAVRRATQRVNIAKKLLEAEDKKREARTKGTQ